MVITVSHLELVLASVDDDGGDLLIHEDENGAEESGDDGGEVGPPRVDEEWDHPATVGAGWLIRITQFQKRY